mgnify:CR=1 FL=1
MDVSDSADSSLAVGAIKRQDFHVGLASCYRQLCQIKLALGAEGELEFLTACTNYIDNRRGV